MNETPATGFDPLKPLMASMKKTNQMMVEQTEKWVELRMDSLRAYLDLGLAQIKVALKVTDPHSLHEFVDSQFAVGSFVGHRILDDGRALAEWGTDCCGQANRLARENALHMLFKC
ncbi:MAG TPA: phasin family protein [Candidatus Competibacter sp.]|nr:phasin family protein [Candidatus Competibacter sp.]